MKRFKKGNHCIYNIGYHVVWIPKYRKRNLKGMFKEIIKKALFEKAKQLEIIIENIEIMPDHVHLFIKCKPTHAISTIVKILKGYSSYKIRMNFPKYKKLYKHFWSSGYYCESVGHISESTIKRYIDDQWKK